MKDITGKTTETIVVKMTPKVYDNILGLVTDILDTIDEENFDTRREYLGYVAELSEIFDVMQAVK